MTIAESARGSSPSAFMRLKVSRPEIPASTRILVLDVCTTALLPRLPLASTETDTAICSQHTCWCCESGSNFLVSGDFSADEVGNWRHSQSLDGAMALTPAVGLAVARARSRRRSGWTDRWTAISLPK